MRLALALVPLLLFSGCLAAPDDQSSDVQASDDSAASDDAGLRQGVVFHDADYQVLPNEPLEFMVRVPDGARNVKVEMSVSGAATPLDEAAVNLSGCGGAHLSWSPGANIVVSVSVLGGSWREADLCPEAGAGERMVTLDGGLTPLTGRLLLRADLPDP